MSLTKNIPYFIFMPQPDEGWEKELLKIDDLKKFLEFLSAPDVLNVLVLLYKRDNKQFTKKLLEKSLNISKEKSNDILEQLKAYNFITISKIELDDEIKDIYNFKPTPAFIPFLAICKDIIFRPKSYFYFNENRSVPYLYF